MFNSFGEEYLCLFEMIFVCNYSQTYLFSTWNIYGKTCYKNFFGRSYHSNCTKIHLNATLSKNIGALIRSMKCPSPEVFRISINLPYGPVSNTVVMSGLVLLVATWNCWISYKNRYARLLVLPLLPPSNPWLIVKV